MALVLGVARSLTSGCGLFRDPRSGATALPTGSGGRVNSEAEEASRVEESCVVGHEGVGVDS